MVARTSLDLCDDVAVDDYLQSNDFKLPYFCRAHGTEFRFNVEDSWRIVLEDRNFYVCTESQSQSLYFEVPSEQTANTIVKNVEKLRQAAFPIMFIETEEGKNTYIYTHIFVNYLVVVASGYCIPRHHVKTCELINSNLDTDLNEWIIKIQEYLSFDSKGAATLELDKKLILEAKVWSIWAIREDHLAAFQYITNLYKPGKGEYCEILKMESSEKRDLYIKEIRRKLDFNSLEIVSR